MNRIRFINNKYQVLITPAHTSEPSFNLLSGDMASFETSKLHNYSVVYFNKLDSAKRLANKYPDIDWDVYLLSYNNAYIDLKDAISDNIRDLDCNMKSIMVNSLQLKNMFFDRVIQKGHRFNLSYDMADVIKFVIITKGDPEFVVPFLVNDKRLRIKKIARFPEQRKTILLGITDLSMPYMVVIQNV